MRRRRASRTNPFGLDARFPFLHVIEAPTGDEPLSAHTVTVRGWIALPPGAASAGPWIEHGGVVPLAPRARPDVEAVFADVEILGFSGLVEIDPTRSDADWALVVSVDGIEYRTEVSAPIAPDAHRALLAAKAAKLARLEPMLRCPDRPAGADTACGGTLDRLDEATLRCVRCRRRYGATARHFDFLTPELRQLGAIVSTDNVSNHGYDPIAERLLAECADGLVLDNGSGMRSHYREQVVNFEIVDYATTDVLGIGESLPFADESFDGLLSLAVLEHVRDPFRCADEITRVLKPGGRIYVAVPFLQPYHGYPSHFYNMSWQGLENLFVDRFDVEESGTPEYGHPIWTLTWFLESYVQGLPPDTARRFRALRVDELMGSGLEHLEREYAVGLDEERRRELASMNYVLATKRGS